jgi:hypothetical protein
MLRVVTLRLAAPSACFNVLLAACSSTHALYHVCVSACTNVRVCRFGQEAAALVGVLQAVWGERERCGAAWLIAGSASSKDGGLLSATLLQCESPSLPKSLWCLGQCLVRDVMWLLMGLAFGLHR